MTLDEVRLEIGLSPTATLVDCFANANDSGFDPVHVGNKDRLSNFINYSHIIKLATPVNVVATYDPTINDGTGACTWDAVPNAEEYFVGLYDASHNWLTETTAPDPVISFWYLDVQDAPMTFEITARATGYEDSEIAISNGIGQLATPTNAAASYDEAADTLGGSWDAVTDATAYWVVIWVDAVEFESFSTTGVGFNKPVPQTSADQSAYFTVSATATGYEQSGYDTSDTVTIPLLPKLATPTSVVLDNYNDEDDDFEVNWGAVPNAESYDINVSIDGVQQGWVDVGNSTSTYVDMEKDNSQHDIFVTVVAKATDYINSGGGVSNTELMPGILPAPTNLISADVTCSGCSGGDGKVFASWDAIPGATSYNVYFRTNSYGGGEDHHDTSEVLGVTGTETWSPKCHWMSDSRALNVDYDVIAVSTDSNWDDSIIATSPWCSRDGACETGSC